MGSSQGGQHVAVIGAGAAGLAAIKSLREEGYRVTCFERRSESGGIWAYSEDPAITSVTKYTSAQLSKYLTPFSDFPHSDVYPRHARGTTLGNYYQEYARHFDLDSHIHYGTKVTSITHQEDETSAGGIRWTVHYEDVVANHDGEKNEVGRQQTFDKIVYAIGSETIARLPVIEGLDLFEGQFLHAQAFKRPEDFKDQRVVIIGQGNSGADCAVELSAFAKTVYFAHRRGAVIVPRMVDGQRFDKAFSWKATRIGFWLTEALPRVGLWLTNTVFHSAMQKAWGVIEPEFRLQAHPRYTDNVSTILINDDLIPALRSGRVLSTHGIRKVVGPRMLEMDDGSVLEDVDAVIACTGYNTSFDILGDAVTFTQTSDSPKVPPQPDLYQNVFSLSYPDSLAFLNFIVAPENAAGCRELAAMAIAQVWAGKSSLPPMETMKRDVAAHQIWFEGRCLKEPVPQLPGLIRGSFWLEYMHQMAGTGLYEYLGGGGSWLGSWQGWLFALKNPRVYFTMAYGVNTPHLWRHFETGKRRAWKGAWEAIQRVNEMSREDLAKKEDKGK